MTKPHRKGRKTRAILNRSPHPRRERRPRHNPATPAAARMAAMLRHFQRTGLGKVEYLARNRRLRKDRSRQRRPAAPAYLRNMLLYPVRERCPAKRMTLVPRLTPRLAVRPAPQAPRATLRRRLLQPVARRRLAAVPAVQTKTALQFPDPITKPRVLLPKPRGLLSKQSVLQLKTRDLLTGSLGPRHSQRVKRLGTTHPQVDSFFDSNVNPLLGCYEFSCLSNKRKANVINAPFDLARDLEVISEKLIRTMKSKHKYLDRINETYDELMQIPNGDPDPEIVRTDS